MKKDILFLCQFFYPEFVSSATLPFDTAVALKEAGYSVDALCGYPHEYSDGQELPKKETVRGIGITRVKYLQLDRKSFIGRLVNYFSFTFMMLLHLFQMARYKAVIVYSNPPILPWVASWAKVLFGTKLIFVAYDLYPEIAIRTNTLREGNIICRLMNHINKAVYRRADCVVALSSEMKTYIVENRFIDPHRVAVIPNWYADSGMIDRKNLDTPLQALTKGRFTVSYFGNMGTAQDMDTIQDAMRKLKDDEDLCFLFAGHGNKVEKLKSFIEEEKIPNAHVFDFLRGKDFQDALAISDCAFVSLAEGLTGLCVPSKTYSYMMQGIPLLAIMDHCDIVEDIEAGAGAWVHSGESDKLADMICALRADSERQQRSRLCCRELYLKKYTTEICTGHYVRMIRDMLDN